MPKRRRKKPDPPRIPDSIGSWVFCTKCRQVSLCESPVDEKCCPDCKAPAPYGPIVAADEAEARALFEKDGLPGNGPEGLP